MHFDKEDIIEAVGLIAGFAVGFFVTLKIPNFKFSEYVIPVVGVVIAVASESFDNVAGEFGEGFGVSMISKLIMKYVGSVA